MKLLYSFTGHAIVLCLTACRCLFISERSHAQTHKPRLEENGQIKHHTIRNLKDNTVRIEDAQNNAGVVAGIWISEIVDSGCTIKKIEKEVGR